MSKAPVDKASLNFFHTIADFSKEAVDLSPETEYALGIPGAKQDELDELEAAAAGGEQSPPAPVSDAPPPPSARAGAAETSEPVATDHVHDRDHAHDPDQVLVPVDGEHEHLIDASTRPSDIDADGDAVPAEEDETPLIEAPSGAATGPDRLTHGKIFSARRTHPMRMYDVLTAKYGDDWLFWEPETLWWAIRRDFGPIGELTRNKLQALRTASLTYSPWGDWDVFENCGLAWNDGIPIFGAYQPMPASQVAFTVQVLKEIHAEAPWDNETAAYMAAVLDDAGWVYAPEEWFPGAQALLDRKDWLLPLKVDVAEAWAKIAGQDLTGVEWNAEDPVHIHLARLYVVQTYLNERAAIRNGDPRVERTAVPSTPTSPPVP